LIVVDNGQGCDADKALAGGDGSGSGLRGLRDRVRAYDGELHVESAPGRGFRISVDIPLPTQRQVA